METRPAQLPPRRRDFGAAGVYVFVMTPFCHRRNRQGRFVADLAGMETNTRYFSQVEGAKLLVICGGSGEFHSLTPAEVRDLAAAAVAGAAGRCRVICGVGGSTATAAAMAHAAEEVGCDAVLVMPHPPLVKQGEAALWAHHRAVCQAVDIGVLPFRAPNQALSPALLQRLARLEKVVAIKEESGAVDWVRTGIRLTHGALPIVTGGGENMVPYYYLAGAVGFTTGMANLTLASSIALHQAAAVADWQRAMAWRDFFEPLTALRAELGNQMLKGGLEMMGLAGGPIRDSGAVLDAQGRRRTRRLLRQQGLL